MKQLPEDAINLSEDTQKSIDNIEIGKTSPIDFLRATSPFTSQYYRDHMDGGTPPHRRSTAPEQIKRAHKMLRSRSSRKVL